MNSVGMEGRSQALRRAVHAALVEDCALSVVLGGPKVYDERPDGIAFPYVTLDEVQSAEAEMASQVILHAWSRCGGHGEAHAIAGALFGALENISIATTQFATLSTRLEGLRVDDLAFGGASAKTVTISLGVKGPAGIYGVFIWNSAATRSRAAEFTISAPEANTDVYKVMTFPGDQTGTWLKDSGIGFRLDVCLAAGTTFPLRSCAR
jgi:hypothetical protein